MDHAPATPPRFPARIERMGAGAAVVVICEHASNALTEHADLGGDLGVSLAARGSHAAWDIGALGLARSLAARLADRHGGAVLIHAPLSRLICDLNRAPDHPASMPARSEIHEIPGNRALTATQRQARIAAVYAPFHAGVQAEIARILASGQRPALIGVHSFTPIFHRQPRAVEFGVLHNDDAALSLAVMRAAAGCGLDTRLNEPYSGVGDVAHTMRLHALPCRLTNTMLEIRNDLIDTPAAQDRMAGQLAPILSAALEQVGVACPVP